MREKAVFPSGRTIRKMQYGNFQISIYDYYIKNFLSLKRFFQFHQKYQIYSYNQEKINKFLVNIFVQNYFLNKINNNKIANRSIMKASRPKLHKSSNMLLQETFQQRQWLQKHGKQDRILFNDHMLKKLRKYFVDLDQDNSNSVSSNQLEDPLILFGMCDSKQQVDQLFRMLDADGSGQLEFDEFLHVFRKVASQKKQKRLCRSNRPLKNYEDFTNLLTGMRGKIDTSIPLRLGMSIYRRKHLINAVMGKSQRRKKEGKSVMKKFYTQVQANPQTKPKLLDPKQIRQDYIPTIPKKKIFLQPIHKRMKTII